MGHGSVERTACSSFRGALGALGVQFRQPHRAQQSHPGPGAKKRTQRAAGRMIGHPGRLYEQESPDAPRGNSFPVLMPVRASLPCPVSCECVVILFLIARTRTRRASCRPGGGRPSSSPERPCPRVSHVGPFGQTFTPEDLTFFLSGYDNVNVIWSSRG